MENIDLQVRIKSSKHKHQNVNISQSYAEKYFSSSSFLNKKILEDISNVRDSYEEAWKGLEEKEKEQVSWLAAFKHQYSFYVLLYTKSLLYILLLYLKFKHVMFQIESIFKFITT